jgi:hypothetical protein
MYGVYLQMTLGDQAMSRSAEDLVEAAGADGYRTAGLPGTKLA